MFDSTTSKIIVDTKQRPVLKHQPKPTFSSNGSPTMEYASPEVEKQEETVSTHSLSLNQDKNDSMDDTKNNVETLRKEDTKKGGHPHVLTREPSSTTSGKKKPKFLKFTLSPC